MVIDLITGQKIRSWRGMVQPQNLLEDLLQFMDCSPSDYHASHSHKRPRENSESPIPHLQPTTDNNNENYEELQRALAISVDTRKEIDRVDPTKWMTPQLKWKLRGQLINYHKGDRNLLCKVGVRLPDGRRIQRNFLRTDPVQEDGQRSFLLTQAIPGASRTLDFDVHSTFEESGLANSMVSVA